MIRPLRARHRRMVAGVGLVVGPLLVLGLLARRPVPTQDALPLPAVSKNDTGQEVGFGRVAVRGALGRAADGSAVLSLAASPALDDRLIGVYWAPGRTADFTRLPDSAYWLGLYDGRARTFGLPPDSATVDGTVWLYVLGRHEVLDAAPISARRPAPAEPVPS